MSGSRGVRRANSSNKPRGDLLREQVVVSSPSRLWELTGKGIPLLGKLTMVEQLEWVKVVFHYRKLCVQSPPPYPNREPRMLNQWCISLYF